MTVPALPSAELDWFSSVDGRAGRVVDLAQRMAELVVSSIQLGHPLSWMGSARRMAGHVVDPAWPSADLVVWSIQLGRPPIWLCGRSSSAIGRAGQCAMYTLQ